MILQPVARALVVLQWENRTYFGYLLPCLGSLLKKFEKLDIEKFNMAITVLQECRSSLLRRFDKYFDIENSECKEAIIATFTLLHFKLRWINNFKSYIKQGQDINEQIQSTYYN